MKTKKKPVNYTNNAVVHLSKWFNQVGLHIDEKTRQYNEMCKWAQSIHKENESLRKRLDDLEAFVGKKLT